MSHVVTGERRRNNMKVCLCLVLLVASTLASPTGDTRIIGGTDAASHSHPWQASLQYNGRHICGASVVSDMWLITAAHCVDGTAASSLTVVVAEHNMNSNQETTARHTLSRVIMHENYNSGFGTFPNDIALLKVNSRINFGSDSKVSTIKLATAGMDFDGNNRCKISGWGYKDDNNGNLVDAPILQELAVDIKSQSQCRSAWGYFSINSGHICVQDGSDGYGACNGDSGGPLSCEVNGEMYLAGATSWGYNGCMSNRHPSVYTRISYFNSWIRENMATK